MDEACPNCGLKLVQPFGRPRSPLLLVGEFPGYNEVMQGKCFVGPTGDVLKTEFQRAGISFLACRATNLWLHTAPKEPELKKMCFDFCHARLMDQISTAKAIFLMGSELAPLFTGLPVSKINGARVTSKLIDPATVVVASYNPAIVLNDSGVVGDFRFAVESFAMYASEVYKEYLHEHR